MIDIEIGPPDYSNLGMAFNNLLSEATPKKNISGINFQHHFKKWAKGKYGYDITFSVTSSTLTCHIDTDETFFILKHG